MRLMRSTAVLVACLCGACATEPKSDSPPVNPVAGDLENGKRVYVLHCARCHGPDGKDEKYPFIARLDGIGKRMTPAEILEATWATGLVSRDSLTPDEQRCLGLYVATL
jgi:mono/diheme cytochrome c family protein